MPPKKPSELIREGKWFAAISGIFCTNAHLYWELRDAYAAGCSREFLAECLEAKGM